MSDREPKPPTHQGEKFPKTMTIPEGWNTDSMTGSHPDGKASSNGSQANGDTRPIATVSDDNLLNRRLEPFPRPNTIPNGWDLSTL